jgi:acyl carrier protein
MELVAALEAEFGVLLDARQIMSIDSLGKALAMVAPRS